MNTKNMTRAAQEKAGIIPARPRGTFNSGKHAEPAVRIVLEGLPGTGKSRLGRVIRNALKARGYNAKLIDCGTLINEAPDVDTIVDSRLIQIEIE